MPTALKVTGKSIRYVRHKVFNSMSQPKFAALLSKQTGEPIPSQRLARFEAYGKRGAVHPEKPTQAVAKFILQHLNLGSSERDSNPTQNEPEALDSSNSDPAKKDDEEPHAWRNLGMTRQELIKKVIDDYQDMGLDRADGETALEMIQSIESKIRESEKDLMGTSQTESISLNRDLKVLKEKEIEIDAEIEKLKAELASLNGRDSIEFAGAEDKNSA